MAVATRMLSIRKLNDLRSDEALVKAAQAGKRDAMSALIERHYPRVLSFLSYLTGSRPQAEDLAQETFTRALGALGRFNGRYRFEPWLLRIAKNLVIDESRRDVHRASPVDPGDLPDLETTTAAVDEVWESMDAISATSRVQTALSRMPLRQATVLILREIEGLSYAEIAQIVGTNDRGVEATLRRARARFRLEAISTEGLEGQRAVCQRTLRLVATEGTTVEATRHLARCDDCKTRSAKVRGADKAFGLLPPLAMGRPGWLDQLTASSAPARVVRSSRNILEVMRGSQAGAVTPFAHVIEMAATLLVAGSMSVASVAGNIKKVATTSAAAAPASVYSTVDGEVLQVNNQVTLDQAIGKEAPLPASGAVEEGAPVSPDADAGLISVAANLRLLEANLDASDLLAELEPLSEALALEEAMALAFDGLDTLDIDAEGPLTETSGASSEPLDLPALPDVANTLSPQVALPRRRAFLA